jgi:hypothetical protein
VKNVEIEIRFVVGRQLFEHSNYSDPNTSLNAYPRVKILDGIEDRNVQILLQNPVLGDQYLVNQAGAVGPESNARQTIFSNGADAADKEFSK